MANPAPQAVQPAPAPAGKSNTGKILLIGCLAIIILILCACASVAGIFVIGINSTLNHFKDVQAQTVQKVCNASASDLQNVYSTMFTDSYKARVPFAQFQQLYNSEILPSCDKLKNLSLTDFFNGGSANYSSDSTGDRIDLVLKLNGKDVNLTLLAAPNSSDWKIDKLDIN